MTGKHVVQAAHNMRSEFCTASSAHKLSIDTEPQLARGQAACVAAAAGKAGNQTAAAGGAQNSHAIPKQPALPNGVYTAAVPSQAATGSMPAAGCQPAAFTESPAAMPPPTMPRRTAVRLPANNAACKAPSPAVVPSATLAATGTTTAAAAAVAAGSAGGNAASPQDRRQQNAKAYLARLQEGLPAAAYQQLMKHLQRYRKDHDTLQVTDGVLDVLRLPSRRHLLLDFAAFLRTQDRDWFLRCVK